MCTFGSLHSLHCSRRSDSLRQLVTMEAMENEGKFQTERWMRLLLFTRYVCCQANKILKALVRSHSIQKYSISFTFAIATNTQLYTVCSSLHFLANCCSLYFLFSRLAFVVLRDNHIEAPYLIWVNVSIIN